MSTSDARHADQRPPALLVVAAVGLLAAIALLVGLVGATGAPRATGAPEPVPRSPEQSLQTMLRALGSGDVQAACRLAAPDGVPIADEGDLRACATALSDGLADLSPATLRAYRGVEVLDATIVGFRATVEPDQVRDRPVPLRGQVFTLVVDGGRWYVLV